MHKNRISATAIGFFVASVIPAAGLTVFAPLSGKLDLGSAAEFLVFYPFSAAATVVFGIPTFLFFRRIGLVTWWSALAGGFFDGILVAVVMKLPDRPDPDDFVTFGSMAAVAALVFWLIWQRGHNAVKE